MNFEKDVKIVQIIIRRRFSRQPNPPLTNINNPYFFNNKTNNSINELTQMNSERF